MQMAISPMRVMGREGETHTDGLEDASESDREEEMQAMLDEIERDHPEKYEQLQSLDSQLRQFGMDK